MDRENVNTSNKAKSYEKLQFKNAKASDNGNNPPVQLVTIKNELELLKRDIKTERDANRALFKKLLDAKSYAENLKKAIETYRKRYYDEKEKCQELYMENTKQRKKIQEFIKSQKKSEDCPNNNDINLLNKETIEYKTKYENEKRKNELLVLTLNKLERNRLSIKPTLPDPNNKLNSITENDRNANLLPTTSNNNFLVINDKDDKVNLECDLFSEYQSHAPNEGHNFTFKEQEFTKIQPALIHAQTLK